MDISLTEIIKMIPEFLVDLVRMFFMVLIGATGLIITTLLLLVAIGIPIFLTLKCTDKVYCWLEARMYRKDKIDQLERLSPTTVYHQIIEYEKSKEEVDQCLTDGRSIQKENPKTKGDTNVL